MPETALPPLTLYVHLPWCVRKCPYCDFNSHALRDTLPEADYLAALEADLARAAEAVGSTRPIRSVFFGGGTPSLFSPAAIGRILERTLASFACAPDWEVTLEANPGTLEHGRFADYRAAGVNRVSLGVQSFDDTALQRIGRIHDADQARRAAESLHAAGLDNFNLDLMYGLPGQDLAGAERDVEQALALDPAHMSHYELTLEPNTLFAARPPKLPDEETRWAMQEACQARLSDAGFTQYEVSAYARPERECRHNLNYWTYGDYLGIGAGAHGKLTLPDGRIERYWQLKHPRDYMAAAVGGGAEGGRNVVPAAERRFEFMLNALRLRGGFRLDTFATRTGLSPESLRPALEDAAARGLMQQTAGHWQASTLGWRHLNTLQGLFLPDDHA